MKTTYIRSNLSFDNRQARQTSETKRKFLTFSTKKRMQLKWRRRLNAWTVIASGWHRCRRRRRPKQSAKAALFPRRRYTTHSRSSASDCCSGFSCSVCCQLSARDFGRGKKIAFLAMLRTQDVNPICCSTFFCKFHKSVNFLNFE